MDGSEHYRLHVRLVLKENIWLVNGYSRCSKLEQASTHKSAQTHAGCVFCDSGKPIYFGAKRSKVKITSHNTSVSIFKQNAILRLAAYVIHDGFFPAAQATLATPDFPCVTSRRLLLLLSRVDYARQADRRCVWSFLQSRHKRTDAANGKSIAVVGLCTLVSVASPVSCISSGDVLYASVSVNR